mgnify:CR=1 FL=1
MIGDSIVITTGDVFWVLLMVLAVLAAIWFAKRI